MIVVTDSGTDLSLTPEEIAELDIHIIPLAVTLDGQTYREGLDIQTAEFYRLLSETDSLPTTSQPSAGDFAALYRQLGARDPDILSVHLSSGLSGTVNAAQAGAAMAPEVRVTIVDTKTLSAAAGWQVEAAARGAKANWAKERILALLDQIHQATDTLFTLQDLKYLIHGGRISHMKGLVASVLNIKPLIGVEKECGTYVQMGQVRSFKRAVQGLVDLIARQQGEGSTLRVQVMHAHYVEGAEMLREQLAARFDCHWLPIGTISLVLGAHTGTTMIGAAYAPLAAFAGVP